MIDRERLAVTGFSTGQLLSRSEIEDLQEAFALLRVDPEHPFLASANLEDRAEARRIHEFIVHRTRRAVAMAFPDHEVFLASFLSKGAHRGAAVSFHQDLTYTDERDHRATVLWIPLVDVDAGNGGLQVVPGSHLWTTGSRPGALRELPTEPCQEAFAARAIDIPLAAGSAVAYDAGLVHGSPPNPGGGARPAVGVALRPVGAPLVHVHGAAPEPCAHRVDPAFYLDVGLTNHPDGYAPYPLWAPPVATEDLLPHLIPEPTLA